MMKMNAVPSIVVRPVTWRWKAVGRLLLAGISGLLLLAVVLLLGPVLVMASLPVIVLGIPPVSEAWIILAVLLALAAGPAFVMMKILARARTVPVAAGSILLLECAVLGALAAASPVDALFVAREVGWGDSDVWDYQKFPERAVENAAPVFQFKQNLSPDLFRTIEYRSDGQLVEADFEDFLESSQTTSFLVIKDDTVLYEGYFNGYQRDSIVTSFSTAKSFTSALVGIAIDEGYIHSVDDRMIDYLPELKGRGLDGVTIRDLLRMSSGIRYLTDDEVGPPMDALPFTDDSLSYIYPDLRSLALRVQPDGTQPGTEFNYNNYNPLLLGMILERTTQRPVATYLQEKIWQPLGMEFPASWSLDSEASGFEKMESGINGRAIDFAKFGRLFLNEGRWEGRQILSSQWVTESTAPDPADRRAWRPAYADWKEDGGYYKYMWWGKVNPDGSYFYAAQGHLGQVIYVSPRDNVIMVRFGIDDESVDSWADVFRSVLAQVQ